MSRGSGKWKSPCGPLTILAIGRETIASRSDSATRNGRRRALGTSTATRSRSVSTSGLSEGMAANPVGSYTMAKRSLRSSAMDPVPGRTRG
ncbi:MAG: hypothetical protein WCK73_04215 [Deltaproteobacteria bacterium]